ncbi:tight adherence protein B [Arthrobacter sp. CAN_A214]|uniref:type II secretion system F family protein n=1 Tax=Arthrobacter sp. CAN_A214 TaxID=2787720 RepID=UPI0018CB9231
MTGAVVTLLLAAAVAVLAHTPGANRLGARGALRTTPPAGHVGRGGGANPPFQWVIQRLPVRTRNIELHELPLFVHQLTGLLRAGRSPLHLWEDIERVYQEAARSGSRFAARAMPVIQTARRSAELGLSVPDALRTGATAAGRPTDPHRPSAGKLWIDLAACFDVADSSGAPLAHVLDRYAIQLDSELDAEAARETALAGPKATVVLLTWLPVLGLGLGYLLGVDPLGTLLGSPLGMCVLVLGILLMIIARVWSQRLLAAAEDPR